MTRSTFENIIYFGSIYTVMLLLYIFMFGIMGYGCYLFIQDVGLKVFIISISIVLCFIGFLIYIFYLGEKESED